MKKIQSSFSRGFMVCARAVLIGSILSEGAFFASAQTKSNTPEEKPAQPAKDPFVKKDETKVAAEAKSHVQPETFQQIVQVFEFIETPQADLREWLKANPGLPDGDGLRTEVQKWIEKGSAEVLASQMCLARSGQRAKVESIRELIYPTEFDPIQWSPSAPYPVAFQHRNLGMTLEFDPVLDDGKIYLNQAPEWTEYVGECQQRPEPNGSVEKGDVRVPMIHTTRTTGQVVSNPDKWMLVDVQSARSRNANLDGDALNPDRSVLVFSRSSIHTSSNPDANAKEEKRDLLGYIKFEWIDVAEEAVTQWLLRDELGQWVGGNSGARAAAEELVEGGKAEVAFTRLLPCRSGQRAKTENVREIIYPTEFGPVEQFALSTPNAHETRHSGITVEIDPVYSTNGQVVDLNMAPEIVQLVGQSVSQRYFDTESEAWKPDVVMPIFYTTRITTQLTLIVDQPLLAGFMMPHDDSGQPDPSRRRLLFVTATK